jgi:hypothetical protein
MVESLTVTSSALRRSCYALAPDLQGRAAVAAVDRIKAASSYSTFAYDAHTLNGMTDRAESGPLCWRRDRRRKRPILTMLPWKHVFC